MSRPPLRMLRLANPVVRAVLDSPVHRLLSGALVVLEYCGHRSGRRFRIPLQFAETADGSVVAVAVRPDRKLWWRSFASPAQAALVVRGARRAVSGRVLEGRERRDALRTYLERFPPAAGALGVGAARDDAELDASAAAVVAFDPPS